MVKLLNIFWFRRYHACLYTLQISAFSSIFVPLRGVYLNKWPFWSIILPSVLWGVADTTSYMLESKCKGKVCHARYCMFSMSVMHFTHIKDKCLGEICSWQSNAQCTRVTTAPMRLKPNAKYIHWCFPTQSGTLQDLQIS